MREKIMRDAVMRKLVDWFINELGRVDICKTVCNRRGEVSSPIDQHGLEPPNDTRSVDCRL